MALQMNSTYKLSNGVEIPVIGFGTWQTPAGDVARNAVLDALKAGYRHIDTAAVYQNEEGVGEGIAQSGVPREEIFVTTKLWNNAHGYEEAKVALADSLKKLGLDYVDLYLIHWPNPVSIRDSWQEKNQAAWKYMEEALEQGLVRSIGVSNFWGHHIDSLLETAVVKPHANQIFVCPSDAQPAVVAYNDSHGILTQAYSPLGTGTLLEVPQLKDIANKYGKSVAQVAIRWSLQKGYNPLPKSITTSRIIENIDVFDFELCADDMTIIDGLKGSGDMAKDPDTTTF